MFVLCNSVTVHSVMVLYVCRLIVADGQVSPEDLEETKKSIVEASNFAISIVMVGVGVSDSVCVI